MAEDGQMPANARRPSLELSAATTTRRARSVENLLLNGTSTNNPEVAFERP
jgi:hypothetical protein